MSARAVPPVRSELAELLAAFEDAVRAHALRPTEAHLVAVRTTRRALLSRFAHTLPDGVWEGAA